MEVSRRVAKVLAFVWFVAFYFVNRDAIELSWAVGRSTPNSDASTMCSDMYAPSDHRLAACEYAGPGSWVDKVLARERGASVPWHYYANHNHHPTVWLWWFGVPLLLLAFKPMLERLLAPLLAWVLEPLRTPPPPK